MSPGCQSCVTPAGSFQLILRLAAVNAPDRGRYCKRIALVVAISQPSFCVDWTGTFGQLLCCTTAVGASTKVPDGEYSMRTSDGVRNSKRAVSAEITDVFWASTRGTRSEDSSPTAAHFALRSKMPRKRIWKPRSVENDATDEEAGSWLGFLFCTSRSYAWCRLRHYVLSSIMPRSLSAPCVSVAPRTRIACMPNLCAASTLMELSSRNST